MSSPLLATLGSTRLCPTGDHRLCEFGTPLPLHWLRVRIAGFVADTAVGPSLLVTVSDGTCFEFQLTRGHLGEVDAILQLSGASAVRCDLRPPSGTSHASFARLRLERLWSGEVLWHAIHNAPKGTVAACYYYLIGARQRARNRFNHILSIVPGINFEQWLSGRPTSSDMAAASLDDAGSISLGFIVDGDENDPLSTHTLDSLRAKGMARSHTHAGRISNSESLAQWVETSDRTWLCLLKPGQTLASGAVELVAAALKARPDAQLVYGDDDILDVDGRRLSPRFKPDWDQLLFWEHDYLSGVIVPRALMRTMLGKATFTCADDVIIDRSTALRPEDVVHSPQILFHRRRENADAERQMSRLSRRQKRIGALLETEGGSTSLDTYRLCRVRWTLQDPAPHVCLIVPTRDRLDLLEACVEGLCYGTDYPSYEIVIADNDSQEQQTLDYFTRLSDQLMITVVKCPGPFNYAAINNRAAATTTADVIGFINNDIEVMKPDWLTEMVSWSCQPDVGAVGAKLLYDNGRVQHAGVTLGIDGLAGHAHRYFPSTSPGYMYRLQSQQTVSAVTAACLVVERKKFASVGGFDAEKFPVAFNDVDLCLRLSANGFRSVWTPHAELCHKENASRSLALTGSRLADFEQEAAALRERWGHVIANDPHYNPNLTKERGDFTLWNASDRRQ